MKYDKINGNVAFREEGHKYVNLDDESIKYTSVTTLIEKFGAPFDKNFVSKYKALEKLIPANEWKSEKGSIWKNHYIPKGFLEAHEITEEELNKTQQDILDEWQAINKESCERGTAIHSKIENSFYNSGGYVNLQKFGIGGKFQCKKDYTELDLEYGVYPEYLIHYDNNDIDLHIAGQIDLLVKDGNDITIGDWKTNKELKFKSFYNSYSKSSTKMRYPLTNLEDCNFNHYQLQLSTYAWIIQKLRPDFNIKRLFICHFPHEGGSKIYEVSYLKDEVEKMLKYFVKQNRLEKENAKYERIVY